MSKPDKSKAVKSTTEPKEAERSRAIGIAVGLVLFALILYAASFAKLIPA